MPQRQNFSTGAPWEAIVGYSRAVRAGAHIEVSGTVAADTDGPLHIGDAGAQTRYILKKIENSLEALGAQMKDVVRTRIFVTDISQWEAIGRAHGEFFGDIRPCTSMVEVSALIAPEYLVEIEATAILM